MDNNDSFTQKLSELEQFDEQYLESKPWAQTLLNRSLAITKKAVLSWSSIICRIGDSEIDTDEYVSIFLGQMENLYQDLIADVDAIQEKTIDKIVRLLQETQNLCRDLRIEMPNFTFENIPLCDLYRVVQNKVKELEAVAEIRKKELHELHQKLLKLSKNLGKEPKLLPESPLPLPKEIEELRNRVEALELDAMEREERFFQLKEEIVEIVEELGAIPSLNFEKEILNLSNSEVRICDSELEQLQMYRDRLVKQFSDTKDEIAELRSKVDDLWDKLETDIAERDTFRVKTKGNSLQTLETLKLEVDRLENIKKANIRMFIEKQRQELTEWWNKCHCTEIERNEFSFFYSECFNEDLFELHEREIEKWKNYYDENKEIFTLLEEHKNLWKQHLELELNSGGANRYKNRGGQLLIEEKMRNKLRKRIPKIEENLRKLADAFLIHKGRAFTTFGVSITDYIQKLHSDEDKEFKLKLSAKKQQREQQSVMGSSRMKLFANGLTPTPRQTSKRKIFGTPATEPIKKLKTNILKAANTGMPKVNVSVTKRRSAGRERMRKRLSFKSSKSSNKENKTGSTSYNDFEKDLSTKNNCRSTDILFKN